MDEPFKWWHLPVGLFLGAPDLCLLAVWVLLLLALEAWRGAFGAG